MKTTKEMLAIVIGIIIGLGLLYLGYAIEVMRWHAFQEITHSDISFTKWLFFFSGR